MTMMLLLRRFHDTRRTRGTAARLMIDAATTTGHRQPRLDGAPPPGMAMLSFC